jgi:hypothetical protein
LIAESVVLEHPVRITAETITKPITRFNIFTP